MASRRGAAIVGARILTGLVGIAVAVVAIGAAAIVPWPSHTAPAPVVEVSPQPTDQQRVCPGPLLALAEDASAATATTAVGAPAIAFWTDSSSEPVRAPLAVPDDTADGANGTPIAITVPVGDGDGLPLISGSQSQQAAGEFLAGFAAAVCGEASGESWLAAGSTDVGRTSLVLLSNPSDVDATVDLTVFGESGTVAAPGATGLLVPAQTQRVVSLAGLAPNLRSPVVHVLTRGGQVYASLESSIVRGLSPDGVELTGPTGPPASSQVITGIGITGAAPSAVSSDEGADDSKPGIRLLAPGDQPAAVEIGLTSEGNAVPGTSLTITLQPGVVTEVPLDALTPGTFTAVVASDQPIVASARTIAAGTAARDFAWHVSSAAIEGDFLVSVAPGTGPRLSLYNPGTADAAIEVTRDGGQPAAVTVPAGASVGVPATGGVNYAVSGGDALVASVSYQAEGIASAFALNPVNPLAAPLEIYPG
ncbi:DUF5719 family protein [Compostimonas suwonensis]|uniref:Large extracellular alpha-helical protein n=1 Tax=Compostimonas suwonensis TaxID=1048394 RepID=A0A2M9BUT0_9MICO|nr:DUF5719 family protein [Compostimonas suwonensis]PJJ61714.1 hypothetical protein CLV54_2664 [Compostimonas suwonensis]